MSTYALIAIADGTVLAKRDFVAACVAAAAGGATCIQIRMKHATASELLRITAAVVDRVSVPVFVNDRADIALLGGAAGVHLGCGDLPIAMARALPGGSRLRIGASVGDAVEAAAVGKESVDYWGVGPVYPTANKNDVGESIGCDGLERMVRLAGHTPVVAIGGVTTANAANAVGAGARGVAVIGAIFGSSDVQRATAELRAVLDGAGV